MRVRRMAGDSDLLDENDEAHELRPLSQDEEEYQSALEFLKCLHRYPHHSHSFPLDVIYEEDDRRGQAHRGAATRSSPSKAHALPRTRTAGSLVDLAVAAANSCPDSSQGPRALPPLSPEPLRRRKRTNEEGGDSGRGYGTDEWGFFDDGDEPESIVVRRGLDLALLALNSHHHATYSRGGGRGLKNRLRFDKKY